MPSRRPHREVKISRKETHKVEYVIEGTDLGELLLRGFSEAVARVIPEAQPGLFILHYQGETIVLSDVLESTPRGRQRALGIEGSVDSPALRTLVDIAKHLGSEG